MKVSISAYGVFQSWRSAGNYQRWPGGFLILLTAQLHIRMTVFNYHWPNFKISDYVVRTCISRNNEISK